MIIAQSPGNSPMSSRIITVLRHPAGKLLSQILIPFIVTIATTWGLSLYNRNLDEREKTAKAFIEQSRSFETSSYNLYSSMADNKGHVDPKTRTALVENLVKQAQTLADASRLLKLDDQNLAKQYQQDLVALRLVIPDVSDDMGPFWALSKKILFERNELIEKLSPRE